MGRKRKDNPLGLPDRTYFKHGRFWFVHKGGRWEDLGTDLAQARETARRYGGGSEGFGTIAYYAPRFLAYCALRVKAKKLAPRTLADYTKDSEPILDYFGKMAPASVLPSHVGRYLDLGVELDRAVRANRERAMLSAMCTWMIRADECPGFVTNPCLRVKRNSEEARTRYVEDAEYAAVYGIAPLSIRGAMELEYRTLQRPDDVLGYSRANVIDKPMGRVLRLVQSKTQRTVEIALTGGLGDLVDALMKTAELRPLVHTTRGRKGSRGGRYTVEGIGSMLRKLCKAAGVKSFGLQDLKAKGATDMYLAGTPLEQIQILCGHESVTTTEIYIKRHLVQVAAPNQLKAPGAI